MTEAEEMVRQLGESLAGGAPAALRRIDAEWYTKKLRDSGLVRLIEAGQFMRGGWPGTVGGTTSTQQWDAAFADMRKRVGRT